MSITTHHIFVNKKLLLAFLGQALSVMTDIAFSQNLDIQPVDYYVGRHRPVKFNGNLNNFEFAGSVGFKTEFFWAGLRDIYRDGVQLNTSDYRVSALNKFSASGPGWCTERCEYLNGGLSKVTAGGMLPGQYAATIDFSIALRPNSSPDSSQYWSSFYPTAQFDWEVKKSKTYALTIGVRDTILPLGHLEDAAFSDRLSGKLRQQGVEVINLQADTTLDLGVSVQAVHDALQTIKDKIKPQDSLIVYIGSHGAISSTGNEFLRLGPKNGSTDNFLADFQLTELLRPFNENQKIVFLDACRAGGFWNDGSTGESAPQFESLDNIAFYAAAAEDTLAGVGIFTGQSYFGEAVEKAVDRGLETFSAIELGNFIYNEALWDFNWRGKPVWAEKEFGDTLPEGFSPVLFSAASADFGSGGNGLMAPAVSSVPEAPSVLLFFAGLAAVFAGVRSGRFV